MTLVCTPCWFLIAGASCFILLVLILGCGLTSLLVHCHNYVSLSNMESMRNVMELLGDMLQAVNPNDRAVCEMVFLSVSPVQIISVNVTSYFYLCF